MGKHLAYYSTASAVPHPYMTLPSSHAHAPRAMEEAHGQRVRGVGRMGEAKAPNLLQLQLHTGMRMGPLCKHPLLNSDLPAPYIFIIIHIQESFLAMQQRLVLIAFLALVLGPLAASPAPARDQSPDLRHVNLAQLDFCQEESWLQACETHPVRRDVFCG